MSQQNYNAEAIEVLNGLEPVKRRPGMYTDTVRPNHLGQEVIDNSVDEAMAGHATKIGLEYAGRRHALLANWAASAEYTVC